MTIEARAPGKLILLGEYAVLDGAPALVASVDRFAEAAAAPCGGDRWVVQAPDVRSGSARLQLLGEEPHWQGDREGMELVDCCLRRLLSAQPRLRELPPQQLRLSTASFRDRHSGQKLGLGSSAALAVALVRCLQGLLGEDQDSATVFPIALDAHRSFQQGRGSGVDVAASAWGGVISYRRQDDHAQVEHCLWPEKLDYAVVWTGRAESTGRMLSQLSRWRASDSRRSRSAFARLCELARRGAEAFIAGRTDAFIEHVDLYGEALEGLGRDAGMDIISTTHGELRTLADAQGVAYKPSGAGGGDFGIAFSDNRSSLEDFCAAALAAGYAPMPVLLNVGT